MMAMKTGAGGRAIDRTISVCQSSRGRSDPASKVTVNGGFFFAAGWVRRRKKFIDLGGGDPDDAAYLAVGAGDEQQAVLIRFDASEFAETLTGCRGRDRANMSCSPALVHQNCRPGVQGQYRNPIGRRHARTWCGRRWKVAGRTADVRQIHQLLARTAICDGAGDAAPRIHSVRSREPEATNLDKFGNTRHDGSDRYARGRE